MNHLTIPAKKSLRFLGLFIITLCAATALSSCEPDDDDYYYSIVGSWQQVAPEYGPVYQFNGDGTGMCYDDYYGDSYFTWSADEYTIGLYFTNGYEASTEYYDYSFRGNSLYMYPQNDYDYYYPDPLVLQPY